VSHPYAVCAYVLHYQRKNSYAPRRGEINCTAEEEDLLAANGVIEFFALHEGGPKLFVALTEKGERMAVDRSGRSRQHWRRVNTARVKAACAKGSG
jgi:hypothetical protein